MLVSVDPTSGEEIARWDELTPAELEDALAASHRAFEAWRRTSFEIRQGLLRRVATNLRDGAEALARLMATEMGKPVAEGRAEVEKCAWVCEHYAEHGEADLASVDVATEARRSFVAHRPLGPVLAVMPWNFPLWQVFRFAAPAVMAGNTALLKHASNVTGCALEIERLFATAGAPPGLFTTLRLGSRRVGAVIDDRRVAAVTLTGSTPAGKAVAERAGRALKKTVLELGGSDPYVVLEDADVELAARVGAVSRLINSGQSCIAAKRFVVVAARRAELEERLVAQMASVAMGDPRHEDTRLGPQARHDLRDDLHRQVTTSLAAGARCLLGGELPEGPGAFYPATVLGGVGPGMAAYDEELFGPVAAVIPVADEGQALAVANDTVFGLGAAIFSRDQERAAALALEHLEAGCCFVNDFVRSDPRLPFGGVKESGWGRELGAWGIREFTNVKTIWVA